ncbi:ester cyclase [Persicimonas caeni]|uniref:Ester cyclase n=1 Tax=Persicimonas caeni TaxID=2292766 RepID=A0A4Y6PVG8_PERCE|nr:ester cyclase [Persicimonas caeni]QDG52341.1 ester cyclase [Persicimonas caeni]QED33563.1 ester cyclase [Persicimonas caeni]
MANENYKEIGRKLTDEIWNKGDIDAIDRYYADNAKIHTPMATFDGKEGLKQFLGMHREAFPDLKVEQHKYYSNGNSTALEWTFTGTHNGPFLGIEPTGKSVRVSGMTSTRYENDKVVEQNFYWDRIDQLQAVGLGPEDLNKLQMK